MRVPLQIGGPGGIEMINTALVTAIPPTFGVKGFIGIDVVRQFDILIEEAMIHLTQRVQFS